MSTHADQALALAGVWQSAVLAQRLGRGAEVDNEALEASLGSIFCIDADDVPEVFGGAGGVRLGLEAVVRERGSGAEDVELTRMALTMLQLERNLAARQRMQARLQEGILAMERQREHYPLLHATISARLGALYEETLSQLRPRIMVRGDATLLADAARVARIRAVLLAGIRAAVLWRQLGGRRWHLMLRRRQIILVARGLLSRLTLEHGQ